MHICKWDHGSRLVRLKRQIVRMGCCPKVDLVGKVSILFSSFFLTLETEGSIKIQLKYASEVAPCGHHWCGYRTAVRRSECMCTKIMNSRFFFKVCSNWTCNRKQSFIKLISMIILLSVVIYAPEFKLFLPLHQLCQTPKEANPIKTTFLFDFNFGICVQNAH